MTTYHKWCHRLVLLIFNGFPNFHRASCKQSPNSLPWCSTNPLYPYAGSHAVGFCHLRSYLNFYSESMFLIVSRTQITNKQKDWTSFFGSNNMFFPGLWCVLLGCIRSFEVRNSKRTFSTSRKGALISLFCSEYSFSHLCACAGVIF